MKPRLLALAGAVALVLAAGLALTAGSALAHEVVSGTPEAAPRNWSELARAWEFDPLVVTSLLLSAVLYARGVVGRGGLRRGVRRRTVALFAAGWATLVVALVSPLHPWGEALFAAHMTQHELLMLVAAPLLVLGSPLAPMLRGLPHAWVAPAARLGRSRVMVAVMHGLRRPMAAFVLHAVVLWTWHAPWLFESALENSAIHALQHTTFLASAVIFWWAIVRAPGRSSDYGAAVLFLFATALHSGLLGALITLSESVWYPTYRVTAPSWGLTPLRDQELGGLVMWIPACSLYIVVGLVLFARWMRSSGERVRRAEVIARGLGMVLVVLAPLAGSWGCGAAGRTKSGAYWVCVSNERSGDITVLDGVTRAPVATIPVGKRPRGIHGDPTGRFLYVALSGTPAAGPPGARTAAIASAGAAQPDRSADGIGVVDLETRKLVRVIPVGTDPEEFAVSRDGAHLFVSNEDAATLSVVSVRTGVIERTVPVGEEPEGVTVAPDGRSVYVTCEARGEIVAVPLGPGRGGPGRYEVAGRPRSIAFTRDGRSAFVSSETTASVHVLDPATGRVTRTVALPEGARPMKVLLAPDGSAVYVSNGRAGTIAVLDPRTARVRAIVGVGTRPWGLGVSPDGDWLYVANGPSNDVSVVDLKQGTEAARLPAGQGPWGIAVVPRSG